MADKIDITSKSMYSKDTMYIFDYTTSGGKNLIMEYIEGLPDALKAEVLDVRQLIREKGIESFKLLVTRQLYKKLWEINDKPASLNDVKTLFPNIELTFRLYQAGGGSTVQVGDTFTVKLVDDEENAGEKIWGAGIPENTQMVKYTVKSNEDGSWKMTIPDLPKSFLNADGTIGTYSYYVVEEEAGLFVPFYQGRDENGDLITDEGIAVFSRADALGAMISAGGEQETDRTIYIKNSAYTVALPNTGGSGTKLFYLFGLMFTGFAGVGIMMRRRRRILN